MRLIGKDNVLEFAAGSHLTMNYLGLPKIPMIYQKLWWFHWWRAAGLASGFYSITDGSDFGDP